MLDFIFAQVLGIIALVLVCVGYFFKDRNKFLLINSVANIFYAFAFLVLDALVAGLLTLISIFRILFLFIAEKKKWKHSHCFLLGFIILYAVVTVIFASSWLDVIPLITSVLFTIGISFKNLQIGRFVLLMPNIILVFYNVLVFAYASALLNLIELIVILIAIIKNEKERRSKLSQMYESKKDESK